MRTWNPSSGGCRARREPRSETPETKHFEPQDPRLTWARQLAVCLEVLGHRIKGAPLPQVGGQQARQEHREVLPGPLLLPRYAPAPALALDPPNSQRPKPPTGPPSDWAQTPAHPRPPLTPPASWRSSTAAPGLRDGAPQVARHALQDPKQALDLPFQN